MVSEGRDSRVCRYSVVYLYIIDGREWIDIYNVFADECSGVVCKKEEVFGWEVGGIYTIECQRFEAKVCLQMPIIEVIICEH